MQRTSPLTRKQFDAEEMTKTPQCSIATSFQYGIPIEGQIPLVAEAGFSHISLGFRPEHSGYLDAERRTDLRARLSSRGLSVDSIHARNLDDPEAVAQASATARAAAELGAPCVVAHIGPFHCQSEGLEERVRSVVATCNDLLPVARETGVVFALENVMPGPATDLVRRALLDLDPDVFGLCYDSAHDQIEGPRPFDLIDDFPGRIFAVHLSDRIKEHVDHVIPGEGFIAWPEMCANLRSAQYSGPILMEVMMTHSRFQEPTQFLCEAYRTAVETWKLIHNGASNQRPEATADSRAST